MSIDEEQELIDGKIVIHRGEKQTPDKIDSDLRTPMRKKTLVKFCDKSVSAIETSD